MGRARGLGCIWLSIFVTACASSVPDIPPEPSVRATGFTNGGECPTDPSGMLADAGCVTTVEGDVDGNGASETLSVYAQLGTDQRPRSWRVRIAGPSQRLDQRLDAGSPHSYPRAIGAADIDGDGRDEWFIKVNDFTSHGAPWQRLNLFVLRGRRLQPVTVNGEPLSVNTGGISRLGEGAACRRGGLVLLRAEARNRRNTRWETSERIYDLSGAEARLVNRREGVLRIDGYNDPGLDPYYRLDCGDLRYPS